MIDLIVNLPLWQIIRSFGIISFILITVGIALGISYSYPMWNGRTKARIYRLHTLTTNAGTLVGLLHGAIIVIDTYAPFTWKEVLVPFAASSHPVLNGIGTLAGYGLLVLIFTSDIRNKLNKYVWRAIHLLAYPIFGMALVHGFALGTDTANVAVRWMYVLSVLLVVGMTVARVFLHTEKPAKAKQASVS
jgi:sulfoxide reductase heme-binding subunit YedZ